MSGEELLHLIDFTLVHIMQTTTEIWMQISHSVDCKLSHVDRSIIVRTSAVHNTSCSCGLSSKQIFLDLHWNGHGVFQFHSVTAVSLQ